MSAQGAVLAPEDTAPVNIVAASDPGLLQNTTLGDSTVGTTVFTLVGRGTGSGATQALSCALTGPSYSLAC